MSSRRLGWGALAALVFFARFCHSNILWVEEAYPTAAAREMLSGKVLYRDIWFDKPPLFPALYQLWGAATGWPLRLAGSLFILLCCWLAARLARALWTERESLPAAWLLGFFLTFGVPAAVMALTPDLLLIPLHLLAITFAVKDRPFEAGLAAGVGLLVNTKALFVVAACALWQWQAMPVLMAGFLAPHVVATGWMWWQASLAGYRTQVWDWGALYSRDTPFPHPLAEGLRRTLNWAGFHAAALIPAGVAIYRDRLQGSWRWFLWAALSLAAAWLGLRFFPRYYFHLLPVVAVLGARGLTLLPTRPRWGLAALLLIPLIRFGPTYYRAAITPESWSDLALYRDSVESARKLKALNPPRQSLLVWGYRPELYPLTGYHAATPFLDSQPLNGVFADRHLTDSTVSAPRLAERNLELLKRTQPAVIIDGLGPLNPSLAIGQQPELADWFRSYEPKATTAMTRIYVLRGR